MRAFAPSPRPTNDSERATVALDFCTTDTRGASTLNTPKPASKGSHPQGRIFPRRCT